MSQLDEIVRNAKKISCTGLSPLNFEYATTNNHDKQRVKDLMLKVIDTSREIIYVKGNTPLETADNIKDVDRYCEIREELREEQRKTVDQL